MPKEETKCEHKIEMSDNESLQCGSDYHGTILKCRKCHLAEKMVNHPEVIGTAMNFNDLVNKSQFIQKSDLTFLLEEIDRWKQILLRNL